MTDGDDAAQRFLPRIRQELDKLPLTEQQKDAFANQLARNVDFITLQAGRLTSRELPESADFTFADRIRVVATHFQGHGLTAYDLLTAVVRRPQIVAQKPETLIRHIEGVVDLFTADGLTTHEYLQAALKQWPLFTQSPETLADNIIGLVERFKADGLSDRDYLNAALKHPSLFSLSPENVANHITGVVDRFEADGLTTRDYLKAALKQPLLFTLTPETVADHITGVVDRFETDGLTTREYLKSALKQPSLFTLSPETIARHIDTVLGFSDSGIFRPPLPRHANQRVGPFRNPAHAAVIDFLLKRPALMCLADDNFGLREVHQRLTDGPKDAKLLTQPRHIVENALSGYLGHPNRLVPVPNDGFVAGAAPPTEEQAKRFLLRALMHAGFIKDGTMER